MLVNYIIGIAVLAFLFSKFYKVAKTSEKDYADYFQDSAKCNMEDYKFFAVKRNLAK